MIMTDTMKHYDNLRTVPKDALKTIEFGKLKGKSDISPQFRVEAMTREFGPCGIGWRWEVVDTWKEPATDGQIMLFVKVAAYIKDGYDWSAPVFGFGGDFLLEKDKNGLHGNEEAYKMATTDALGTALKMFGVAADVYRGLCDSKYGREGNNQNGNNQQNNRQNNQRTNNQKQPQSNAAKQPAGQQGKPPAAAQPEQKQESKSIKEPTKQVDKALVEMLTKLCKTLNYTPEQKKELNKRHGGKVTDETVKAMIVELEEQIKVEQAF